MTISLEKAQRENRIHNELQQYPTYRNIMMTITSINTVITIEKQNVVKIPHQLSL